MPRTTLEWHDRFRQQAAWTVPTRRYLLNKAGLNAASRILEVGCGTGIISAWLVEETGSQVVGLDRNLEFLHQASHNDLQTAYCGGDASALPFPDRFFDAVVSHYFLLWISNPNHILREMARVTRAGGTVIAFAEPDYGGRIDAPPELVSLGEYQADALRNQGAEPNRGRDLAGLFAKTGFYEIETGVIGSLWKAKPGRQEIDSEWSTLENDLNGRLPAHQLAHLKQINQESWDSGERVLYVPTFFAIGIKKDCQILK